MSLQGIAAVPSNSDAQVMICLIRGINVGGNKIVRMEALRALLAKLGYEGAETYIQSGNAVFLAHEPPADCARRMAAAFPKAFGFSPEIMIRTLGEWRKAVIANPFDTATHDPRKLALFCLDAKAAAAALKSLDALAEGGEACALKGACLYAYFPNGMGRSKLAGGIERALKVRTTARNWNTVLKLLEMGEALARG